MKVHFFQSQEVLFFIKAFLDFQKLLLGYAFSKEQHVVIQKCLHPILQNQKTDYDSHCPVCRNPGHCVQKCRANGHQGHLDIRPFILFTGFQSHGFQLPVYVLCVCGYPVFCQDGQRGYPINQGGKRTGRWLKHPLDGFTEHGGAGQYNCYSYDESKHILCPAVSVRMETVLFSSGQAESQYYHQGLNGIH